MSEPSKPNRNLSDISHLFLSSVRDRQTNGARRPERTPPRPDMTIDLTPEEFAEVFGEPDPAPQPEAEADPRSMPVSAVIAAHLNGRQFDRVREYARHLAAWGERVGMIVVDAAETRLICFDQDASESRSACAGASSERFDPVRLADAMEELHWDVNRWLLVVPNPRLPEARGLLQSIGHWVLLSTCDHDGVVSSYRMLKGLADAQGARTPRLSLALLDARDDGQSDHVARKLEGVCRQFLHWPLQTESAVKPVQGVAEHAVMTCRAPADQPSLTGQWEVVVRFLSRITNPQPESPMPMPMSEELPNQNMAESIEANEPPAQSLRETVGEIVVPELRQVDKEQADEVAGRNDAPAAKPAASGLTPSPAPVQAEQSDVIDLPSGEANESSILAAILHRAQSEWIECPLVPPMCPEARLAVGRDRSLVLLAVARRGLAQLRPIAQAYRWLNENRALIGLAMPQFAIDAQRPPRLRLLVDQNDLTAELLQPMFESGHVTVQAYRRLRWGERTGLLLDAA